MFSQSIITATVSYLFYLKAIYLGAINTMIKNTLLSILVLLLASIAGAQTAAFTTSPAAVNGVVTICQGSELLFTNTTTGNVNNVNWTFQGGNPGSSSANGPHVVSFNSTFHWLSMVVLLQLFRS